MSKTTFPMVWDLDVFFEGGSTSKEFATYLLQLEEEIREVEKAVQVMEESAEGILAVLEQITETSKKFGQASAFVSCLQAQNMNDKNADALRGNVTTLSATLSKVRTAFDVKISLIEEDKWELILFDESIVEVSYVLNEKREWAKQKLSYEQEALISSLSTDGYHAWSQMYDVIVGSLKINFNGKELSAGQAANALHDANREVRKELFAKWEEAWEEKEDYIAKALNHIAGYRLTVYKERGWEDVAFEPLKVNRMKKETLSSLWGAIEKNKGMLVQYLNRKAELLGVEKLAWYDVDAPIYNNTKDIPYDEGCNIIIDQFGKFGNQLKSFTEKALNEGWIEAEDRAGKRPGGFCTSFPLQEQSRIFMTYSGTASNVSTLAHELGHAFHTFAMKDVHPLNKSYAMNVAETASTFAEMIVIDAVVKNASTKEEKIALLEEKIATSVAFLMNIHARFLFETNFYEERKKGVVSTSIINELMLEAQKEAYCDALSEYHPHFWASKLHFYITYAPFYNYPYTFGYLFSLGIYKKSLESEGNFEETYMNLLKDTACMTVEDLAMKHLGADLSKEDFWSSAIDVIKDDVAEFLELTK